MKGVMKVSPNNFVRRFLRDRVPSAGMRLVYDSSQGPAKRTAKGYRPWKRGELWAHHAERQRK
jgi:hypothetical protein